MVYLEELLCTLILDTHEGLNIATFDVNSAYINEEIPKYKRILMNLRGYFVNIMCKLNPEYKQDVSYKNGKSFYTYQ